MHTIRYVIPKIKGNAIKEGIIGQNHLSENCAFWHSKSPCIHNKFVAQNW